MSAAEIKLFKNKDLIPHISFSFDGENAGKLMGSTDDMEYSLDGGATYKAVTSENITLTSDEIPSITAKKGSNVCINGNTEAQIITIYPGSVTPDVAANNNTNMDN